MSEEQGTDSARLLFNLGTDQRDVAQGIVNRRIFTIIDAGDKAFMNYGEFRASDSVFWKILIRNEQEYNCAIGGRARRDVINGTMVEKGNVADTKPEKPTLGDHVFHRDKVKDWENWKKEQEIE